jgi:hypothetical protein
MQEPRARQINLLRKIEDYQRKIGELAAERDAAPTARSRKKVRKREIRLFNAYAHAVDDLGDLEVQILALDLAVVAKPSVPAGKPQAGRFLSGALQRLPIAERERYAEEWAADLAEIHGGFARLRWQLGIRLTARRLARSAAVQSPAHRG